MWQYLRDVQVLALLTFTFILLATAWSGVSIIETNYVLQQQIAELDQRNRIRQLENENMKLANQYYETDTYLELAARRQYNKGQPGEKLILIPRAVAEQNAPKLPDPAKEAEVERNLPAYRQNFQDWMDFLLGRNT